MKRMFKDYFLLALYGLLSMAFTFLGLRFCHNYFDNSTFSDFVLIMRYSAVLVAFLSFSLASSYPKFYIQKSSINKQQIDKSAQLLLLLGVFLSLVVCLIGYIASDNIFEKKYSNIFLFEYTAFLLACGFLFARLKSRKRLLTATIVVFLIRSLLLVSLLYFLRDFYILGNVLFIISAMIVFYSLIDFRLKNSLSSDFIKYSLKRCLGDFILPILVILPIFMIKLSGNKELAVEISLATMLMNGFIALLSPLTEILYIKFLDVQGGTEDIIKFSRSMVLLSFVSFITYLSIPSIILELLFIVRNHNYYLVSALTLLYSFVYLSIPYIDATHDGQKFVKQGLVAVSFEITLLLLSKYYDFGNYIQIELMVFAFLALSIFITIRQTNTRLILQK